VTGKKQTTNEQAAKKAVPEDDAPKDAELTAAELDVTENRTQDETAAEPGIGAAAESLVDDELLDMQAALNAAEQEMAIHRDAMLRMQAEMENLRKRLIKDQAKSRKFALERIMKDLLQVRDSLERGLDVIDESTTVESLKEGKALTLKMLTKVMQDHNLEVIDPLGQPFDPEYHEAMTVQPSEEYDDNTVMEVIQKGFKLHDRLIRPAMVVVSGKR
jgi:molecular chaperone GrpE